MLEEKWEIMKINVVWQEGPFKTLLKLTIFKNKRLCNPQGNVWNANNTKATISQDGLSASNKGGWKNIFAEKGFAISAGQQCKMGHPPADMILYYYEIKQLSKDWWVNFNYNKFHIIFYT
jgi:hypothetical protein